MIAMMLCKIGLVLMWAIGAMSTTLPMAAVRFPPCPEVLSHDANDADINRCSRETGMSLLAHCYCAPGNIEQ
jgi:hypothetical protein